VAKAERNHVYVITVIEPLTEPVHTVFNNREAAIKMYNYFVDRVQEVLIDYCPIYNDFEVTK
jgi:hypothetical protein